MILARRKAPGSLAVKEKTWEVNVALAVGVSLCYQGLRKG